MIWRYLNLTLDNILVNGQNREHHIFKFDFCSNKKEKYFGLGIKIITSTFDNFVLLIGFDDRRQFFKT